MALGCEADDIERVGGNAVIQLVAEEQLLGPGQVDPRAHERRGRAQPIEQEARPPRHS